MDVLKDTQMVDVIEQDARDNHSIFVSNYDAKIKAMSNLASYFD